MWDLEFVLSLKGLKWTLAAGIVFLGIAIQFQRGLSLIEEIEIVDNYLIFPFTSVWIITLWGAVRWKKRTSV